MSDRESVITRLIARVRALLPEDWFGRAGERLQKTTAAISDFAEEHNIRPKELLEETVDLGRRKIEGLANREYAAAAKDFAEAEEKKIDIELKRRTLDIKVRKEEAEARAAEIQNLNAEFELLEKLQKANVVIHRDESGNLTVLPTPPNCDLAELIEQKRLSEPIVGRANIESEVFVRESHGLKLFFEALHSKVGASILDLGDASQRNIDFITNLGHRLYSEDFVTKLDDVLGNVDMPDPADENHIDQFLQQTLNFDESQFDGVLVWDVLQYLTPRLLTATIERLHTIVRPGGYVLAYFNSNKGAESVPFYSFRIKDEQHVLLLQRGLRKPFQTFDNAQLERLFHRFESAKFFLTREQPRDIMVRR